MQGSTVVSWDKKVAEMASGYKREVFGIWMRQVCLGELYLINNGFGEILKGVII